MLATKLLFIHVYCLVDDAIKAAPLSIPRRPGPAPACTDAELPTIAVVRHLLGRRSENGFLAEIRRDWLWELSSRWPSHLRPWKSPKEIAPVVPGL
jgi:hypothetical protein